MTTRINLLPWREIRRREQDRQLLSIAIGTWVLMGLVVFYTLNSNPSDGWTAAHDNPPDIRESAFQMGINIVLFALLY